MFHWICPECGREIDPTVRECPACDPAHAAAAAGPAPTAVHPDASIPVTRIDVAEPEVLIIPPSRPASRRDSPPTETLNLTPAQFADLVHQGTQRPKVPISTTFPVSAASVPGVAASASPQSVSVESPTETIQLPPGALAKLIAVPTTKQAAVPDPGLAGSVPTERPKQPAPPPAAAKPKRQDSGRYWLTLSKEGIHTGLDPLARLGAFARRLNPENPSTTAVSSPLAAIAPPEPQAPQIAAPTASEMVADVPSFPEQMELELPTFGESDSLNNPLDALVHAMGMEQEQPLPPAAARVELPGISPARPVPFHAVARACHDSAETNIQPGGSTEANGSVGSREIDLREFERKALHSPTFEPDLAGRRDLPELYRAAEAPKPGSHTLAVLAVTPASDFAFLSTPAWIPEPRLAEPSRYSPIVDHPILPAAPGKEVLKKELQPRLTLPGPALIKKLVKFRDKELLPVLHQKNKAPASRGVPRWMVTALIIGTLLGAGVSRFFTFEPAPPARTSAPSKTAVSNPATDPEASPQASVGNPLSRSVEVTGFRFQVDPDEKSELRYLVINHSANRLSGLTIFVTLHSADAKAGEPPLCRLSFTAPNIGPHESKEMVSSIEKFNRPVALPEWQNLRAEVEIGQ